MAKNTAAAANVRGCRAIRCLPVRPEFRFIEFFGVVMQYARMVVFFWAEIERFDYVAIGAIIPEGSRIIPNCLATLPIFAYKSGIFFLTTHLIN
jgi:hypothetical protein